MLSGTHVDLNCLSSIDTMSKVFILLNNQENVRLLADMLSQHYEVMIAEARQLTTTEFDLCIVDASTLLKSFALIQECKQSIQPVFLPVLLLISQQYLKNCPPSIWQIVDGVTTLPVAKLELQRRVEALLHLRKNSLMLQSIKEELAEKNVRLEQLNAEKNHFVGMAAHDLRSPVSGIMGLSKLLLEDNRNDFDAKQIQWLSLIRDTSELMLKIINGLLDVSAIEAGKLELCLQPVDLIELIERNLNINIFLADKKHILLKFEVAATIPVITLDPYKMEQVLNNLLSNAIKFSHSGTTIKVKLYQEHNWLVIAVKDQGQGIPEAEQIKLFQPFSRIGVKGTRGESGSGLGLAIVKKMVEAQRGKIWFESREGQGSTFYVAFPVDSLGDSLKSVSTLESVKH